MTFPPSDKEFLDPKTFSCINCGQCCRPIVKVTKEDVERLESGGLKKEECLDFDPRQENPKEKDTLKQKYGVCIFLRRNNDQYYCSIYEHRPEVCRKYPFFTGKEKIKDCRPERWDKWMNLKNLVKEE